MEGFQWVVPELYEVMKDLLFDHPGWPNGIYLTCPIFTQNKIVYIKRCQQITNPTLDVPVMGIIEREPTAEEEIWKCSQCGLDYDFDITECPLCLSDYSSSKKRKRKMKKRLKFMASSRKLIEVTLYTNVENRRIRE